MGKSILIFGAGLNQLTLIEAANDLGLKSIVVDPNLNAPGIGLADHFYHVDSSDYNKTKQIAIQHNVDGLVTSQMQNPLRMMSKLADELNLVFIKPDILEKTIDKILMKEAFISNNIPCATGFKLHAAQEINNEYLDKIEYPLIIKPLEAHSSQGVYKVNNTEEINKYKLITAKFSKTSEIIIEEFLDGPEFSVEAITYNGNTTIIQFTEKFVTPFPRTVEIGHLQPAQLSIEQKEKISEVVVSAIDAIGIDNSASHTEVIVTKEGPKIVEIGARLGGDFISSYLTLNSCGVNMDKAAIQVSLGGEPDITPTLSQFSYIKYFELPLGNKVNKIENWNDILVNENVVFANIASKEGDVIEEITESKKRPGFVIVKGFSRTNVLEKAKIYEDKLKQKITLGAQ